MHKEAFEPTGLIPRSIIRTFDRFRQQLLPGTEQIAIQEYRISRYQILVSIKALCTLIFVPFLVTSTVKFFLITPVTEHFWDYQQGDIFLNSYQEKRAFNEMHDFSEKIFFESLVNSNSEDGWNCRPSSQFQPQATFELGSTSDVATEFSSKIKQKEFWSRDPCSNSSIARVTEDRARSALEAKFGVATRNPKDETKIDRAAFAAQKQGIERSGKHGSADGSADLSKRKNDGLGIPEVRSGWALRGVKDPPSFTNQDEDLTLASLEFAELGWRTPELAEQVREQEGQRTILDLQIRFQKKSLEIAETYNKQSILAITCLLGDFVTLLTLYILFVIPQMKPQVIILKSFLTESLYSLSDTTKSFLLILGMDLLVGFHSPRGWEIVLESVLRHFGLPENESFILLFVALFPVFLDTVFKYWIFRYLNKISPSTVVTYHSMLE